MSGDGKVLAPGVVMSASVRFGGRIPYSQAEFVRLYFDSGVRRAGKTGSYYAALGYSICSVRGGIQDPPECEQVQLDTPESHIRQGGLKLDRLDDAHRKRLADSPIAVGSQLYDLVAARLGLVRLVDQGYRGAVIAGTDGKQVIEFLRGRDKAVSLLVEDIDFAPDLRREIWDIASQFGAVGWIQFPRQRNLADRAVREKLDDYFRGFRQGRSVREISFRRNPAGAPGDGKERT